MCNYQSTFPGIPRTRLDDFLLKPTTNQLRERLRLGYMRLRATVDAGEIAQDPNAMADFALATTQFDKYPSMKIRSLFALLSLLIPVISTSAHAQLSIDKPIMEFTAEKAVDYVIATNTGTEPMYVVTELSEVINPESANPVRQKIIDVRKSPVLVSPRQLFLEPGERKRMRVILRSPATDSDQIYRLKVKPYVGDVKFNKSTPNMTSSGVKVSVGYSILLLARPATPEVAVEVTRTNDAISFKNKGNTNVLLQSIKQCNADRSECSALVPNRLYVGEFHSIKLPKQGDASEFPVDTLLVAGDESINESH